MRMLLINTCGGEGVVALADEAGVLAAEALPGRGTSEALMPAVRRLFAGAAFAVRDLDVVGVVTGPGSFTGVRVGLSAAKGLCEAGAVRMVAMSRLALVAVAVDAEDVLAVLDGGRGEYYCGVYRAGQRVSEELLREPETRALLAGRAAGTCEARVAERLGAEVRMVAEPGAESMRATVLARVAAGAWSDVATVDANYLRRTDAELLVNAQ